MISQTNCLTETYFEEAQARAKELDASKAQGKSAGPLHGLPMSIKDGFQIKGSEATLGFVSKLGTVSTKNSALVEILTGLGAIIIVKTNIPQTLMTADSHNNIFGRTLNPRNTALNAGGSSGGEGALVAMPGSIRIPALCCGTYGFRPSTKRIPYGGQISPAGPGLDLFLASAGPLATSMGALQTFMKTVIGARPSRYDSTVLNVPWDHSFVGTVSRPRIGVLAEDPSYPFQPPVRRALEDATRKLKESGIFDLVHLTADEGKVAEAVELGMRFFTAGPKPEDQFATSGEPRVPSVLKAGAAMATWKDMPPKLYPELDELSGVERVVGLNVRRRALCEHWRQLWVQRGIDAVICPPAQHTALLHDEYVMPPYTLFLNTLDVSTVVTLTT
jgi:amidase